MPEAEDRVPGAAPLSESLGQLQKAVGDRYRIERQIGEGGMATVYLAEDLKHHRKVAVKVLQETLAHTIGIRRFLQEIEVIARLQHPHLLTLIDSGDVAGLPYYVMPYVEAQSLRELIAHEKRLPIAQAITIAREVADGLQFAHQHGVIHRDVKPSNILMSGGHAIVADFGIATALERAAVGRLTETGISLGSPTYMSPEQASAEPDLDERTDVYSLGCVLYEMLCGEPPVDDASMQIAVTRKLTGRITPVRSLRPDAPPALASAVHKALATSKEDRFQTMAAFADAMANSARTTARFSRRTQLAGAAVVVVAAVALGLWFQRQRRVVWATQRIAEIDRLATEARFASAFALAEDVGKIIPHDTTLLRIRPKFADFIRIVTLPAGARVERRRMDRPDAKWEMVGTTPLDSVPMPKYGEDLSYQLRVELNGFETAEMLPNVFAQWAAWRNVAPLDTLRLDKVGTEPGMVRIPGWSIPDTLHPAGGRITFVDYHIGKYEVTNREYKRFVAAGGYEKREYWTEPFMRNGREIRWEDAIAEFRDRSGLPGPSAWSSGTYQPGQDDFPVGGVSYYEAAAYSRFAGKRLPTSAHWNRAALRHNREASWIYMATSNLNGSGPRRVGEGVMNSYGLFDVAGNVREWCVNPVDSGRLTSGGGWEDGEFHVGHLIPKPEFDRSASNGIRLISVSDADTTLEHISGRITRPPIRDFSKAVPVSDAEFKIYARLFAYDSLPLAAHVDSSGVSEQYRWEKVSFTAAYAHERMSAYLFLPRAAKPPYQPVIYWPGSNAMTERSFSPKTFSFENFMGFVPRSGRVLVLPVMKGAYERDDSAFSMTQSVPSGTPYYRDLAIQWIKDLRRTVDYLQSRPDVSGRQIGYYGYSWGSEVAPRSLVLEPRIRAAVLNTGGFWSATALPEVDEVNYLPRVRTPTLMLNGRYDVVFPYQETQLPFFRMLGTPTADKKHVVYPSSHTVPQEEMVRETLAWFDKYLGRAAPPQ